MSSCRHTPSASMAKAAMPLDELDQWLVAGLTGSPRPPSSQCWTDMSPRSWPAQSRSTRANGSVRCSPSTRMRSTTPAPQSSRRSLLSGCATTTLATPCRRHPTGSNPSTGVSRTATSTHGPGAGASMPPCSCGCQPGRPCSTPTTSTMACSCPSSCIASTIRGVTDQEGTRGQGTRAQGVHGHPRRCRSHAPILDADPLRQRRVTIPDVEAHTGYCQAA